MRKAILHLGFHKTGTTFLQLAMRRWIASFPERQASIFHSSQHMPESGWLQLRNVQGMRLRHRIAHATLEQSPGDVVAVHRKLSRMGLSTEFDSFREFFDRSEPTLIHSDENSIGDTFGHPGYGRGKLWPFYPNGDWLCATFAAAASASYDEVHLVFSLRRFDEMVASSIKDIVRSPRPIPPLDLFFPVLFDLGIRCSTLIKRVCAIEFVNAVHVLDFELLRRSPQDYFDAFLGLAGVESQARLSKVGRVNESPSDEAILDRLVERGGLAAATRARLDDLPSLIGRDVMAMFARDYAMLREYLLTAPSGSSKIRYYC